MWRKKQDEATVLQTLILCLVRAVTDHSDHHEDGAPPRFVL
jgi:hypothetical protein